jgi:hypothetical protein
MLATSTIEKPMAFYINAILDIENRQAVIVENLIAKKISPGPGK